MSNPKHAFTQKVGFIGAAALVLALGGAPARALAPTEVDDWGTDFTYPLGCSAAGCEVSTTEANISPTSTINRRATLDELQHGNSLAPLPAGLPADTDAFAETNFGCTGCLVFQTGDHTIGSLSLNYQFPDIRPLSNIGLEIANPGKNDFNVAAFYLDDLEFKFGDQYTIEGETSGTFLFEFPDSTMTREVLIIYNPLAAYGTAYSLTASGNIPYAIPPGLFTPAVPNIHAELCCVRADVPEPSAWALMLLGFFGVGASLRASLKRGGPLRPRPGAS